MRPLALATATTLAVASGVALAPQDPHPPAIRLSPAVAAANTVPRPSVDAVRASRSIGQRRALTRARVRAAQRARERARALARQRAAAAAAARAQARVASRAVASTGGYPAVWDRVADCESGGNWAIDTRNGFYGGLQETEGNAAHYGFARPDTLPPAEQVRLGSLILRDQGPGAWPVCGPSNGLTMEYAAA